MSKIEFSISCGYKLNSGFNGAESESIYQMLGFDKSKQLIKSLGVIDNATPVIILSSTEMEEGHAIKQAWYASQKQWLNKNPNSKIIQVSSGHFIQLQKPQIVCKELGEILSM